MAAFVTAVEYEVAYNSNSSVLYTSLCPSHRILLAGEACGVLGPDNE